MELSQQISGSRIRVRVKFDSGVRDVSDLVVHDQLTVSTVSQDVVQAWVQEAAALGFDEPGEVASMRMTEALDWHGLDDAYRAVSAWAQKTGFSEPFAESLPSFLACYGAVFHDDSHGFPGHTFCVLWLSEAEGLDLVFPNIDKRVPLSFGTVVLFDSCQPHGVLRRGSSAWHKGDYPTPPAGAQFFLSWDLSLQEERLRSLMGIRMHTDVPGFDRMMAPALDGVAVSVDGESGAWTP